MLSRVPIDGKAWSSPSLTVSHFIISEEVVILTSSVKKKAVFRTEWL